MMNKTTDNPTHRTLGLLFAVGAGIATYAWRRKVAGKPVLPSLSSAIAIAASAGTALHRFLPNARTEEDGRLAAEIK